MKNPKTDKKTSAGKIADSPKVIEHIFPEEIQNKFEILSYRNAAGILSSSFPKQFAQIVQALDKFNISTEMIRKPGGSKGLIAKYVDTLFTDDWAETRISADLHVQLLHAQKKNEVLQEYVREGFLDGHRIDFVSGRVALDLEWNSKDQTEVVLQNRTVC
jgi:hypothetical protein